MKEVTVEKNGRVRVRTINSEPSMTQQQFAAECDINNIMKKYDGRINLVPFTASGHFADLTELGDYQSMLDKVLVAQDAFASLNADLRKRFNNDPAQLLSFLQDENNYDEGVKLGLLNARQLPEKINANEPNERDKKSGKKQQVPDPKLKPDDE